MTFFEPQAWISLLTLTLLELVLGVDNLVFLTLVTNRVVQAKQKFARKLGLSLACIMRLGLLATASWLVGLTAPLFVIYGQPFSIRDCVLLLGGLFLIVKGTDEIHAGMEPKKKEHQQRKRISFFSAVMQITFLDIVFSLDSVITAVGLTQEFSIMATAIIIAVLAMLLASEFLSYVVNTYPTLRMLALSFLLLVGTALVADGLGFHIPRSYLYVAMGFSIFVETLNLLTQRGVRNKMRS